MVGQVGAVSAAFLLLGRHFLMTYVDSSDSEPSGVSAA